MGHRYSHGKLPRCHWSGEFCRKDDADEVDAAVRATAAAAVVVEPTISCILFSPALTIATVEESELT